MNISTITKIQNLKKLQAGQNTLILNLGFAKCGSTTLQSLILPFLPLKSYTYQGRYYKLILDDSKNIIKVKPGKIKNSLSEYARSPGEFNHSVNKIFKDQNNHVACISLEMLPAELDHVVRLIKSIEKKSDNFRIIYLFSVREIPAFVQSGFSHACLQHLEVKGYPYSINEVIFETLDDAAKEGFTQDSLLKIGGKRPILLENLKLAKIIKQLEIIKANTFIIKTSSLYSNHQLWFNFLLQITQTYEESCITASKWVNQMNTLNPTNQSTSQANNRLEKKYIELNIENKQRLLEIETINNENYPTLGHYWG